jgi:hypothetical protein
MIAREIATDPPSEGVALARLMPLKITSALRRQAEVLTLYALFASDTMPHA